jgi:Tfp pilus assembly PilM family ATPase
MARFLAIDWDQNQLHLAETNISGSNVKILRAVVTQEEQSPLNGDPETLGKLLRERLKAAGISPAPVLACIGRDKVIQKDLRFPSVPDHEEPALVRFQALKELSEAPEDVVIDFTSTKDQIDNGAGETRALVLVLKREVLQSYQRVCLAAGLKLAGLTPRHIGLSACLRRVMGTTTLTPAPDPPDAAVAIVTVAEKWAEFCVVRGKQNVLLARSMTSGPNLAGEVRRNLALYAGQNPQNPVKAVYLAGSGIAAIRERLTEIVEVPLYSFDPFGGMERPELPIANRGSFAGAIGLCYARTEKGGLPINFVQPREPRPPANPMRFRGLAAALAAIVVLAGGFVVRSSLLAQASKEAEELETRRADLDLPQALPAQRAELQRLRELDKWDTSVWLDDIYNITAAIPDVNALRITQITVEPIDQKTHSQYVAKIVLKGTILGRRDFTPLDSLIGALQKDGHYMPEGPKKTGNTFIVAINVEKRAPTDHHEVINAEP